MSEKTSLREVYIAFMDYLDKPKTRWDIKDYSFGCFMVFGMLILLTWLAVVLV